MLLIIAIFYALQAEFAFLLFCFEGCKSDDTIIINR